MEGESHSIEVSGLQFSYDSNSPLFFDFSLKISPGSRCLLVGANGSGKTTLLRILAGKHMVGGREVVRVLNCSAFHDTSLVCGGDLAYLGESWSKSVGSAGELPLQGDFSAEHMIFGGIWTQLCFVNYFVFVDNLFDGSCFEFKVHFNSLILLLDVNSHHLIALNYSCKRIVYTHCLFHLRVDGVDPVRRDKLIDLLDINLQWRMHKVSDGQRRRVQICMGLLHPYKVLLLDEVTVDLDVVARMDLLDFFKEECEQRGATIVYATHIFDGLETWATDLVYVQYGVLKKSEKIAELNELKDKQNLLSVVEAWLRCETKIEKKKPINPPSPLQKSSSPFDASPFRSSRHMAYYR